MQRLLQGVGESVASKQLKQKADVKKSGAIGKGSNKHELPDEEIVVKEEEGESVFLDDVTNLVNYLKKIDNENPNIEAFTQLALFVVMNGSVTIVDKNAKPHAIDKLSALRKLLKGQVYRAARLKPRLSDVDFGVNEVADSALLRDVPRQVSEEEIMSMLREYLPIASELQKYIEKNSLVMPLASHVAVSEATSKVMMKNDANDGWAAHFTLGGEPRRHGGRGDDVLLACDIREDARRHLQLGGEAHTHTHGVHLLRQL